MQPLAAVLLDFLLFSDFLAHLALDRNRQDRCLFSLFPFCFFYPFFNYSVHDQCFHMKKRKRKKRKNYLESISLHSLEFDEKNCKKHVCNVHCATSKKKRNNFHLMNRTIQYTRQMT